MGKGYVRFLFVMSAILLASAVVHTSVFIVNESPWMGTVSWRKPIVFAISFAITNLTLAWVLHLLPQATWKGWVLAVTFGLTGFAEVSLISLQQWRGVPSHFNTANSFDLSVVIAMGALFLPLMLSLLGIAIWSWISLPQKTSLALAMRIGMRFLIVGQAVGLMIILKGVALLRAHHGSIVALYPAINTAKIPHAICLHAVQALCVVGALADRGLKSDKTGRWIVILISLAILAVLGVTFLGVSRVRLHSASHLRA